VWSLRHVNSVETAAQVIAQSGPVGWALLGTLCLVLLLLVIVFTVGFKIAHNSLKDLRKEASNDTARAMHLIGQVKDSVAELRNENSTKFAELEARFANNLGDVRERIGRLEGVAGVLGAFSNPSRHP